jgi:predicted GNAT family acetyltransferase
VTDLPGEVVDDVHRHRFVVRQDDQEAELVYRHAGKRLILLHTGVPQGMSGHGIGGLLVRTAVDLALREDLTLVPYCPFAAQWLRDHQGAVAGLAIDWPADDSATDDAHS